MRTLLLVLILASACSKSPLARPCERGAAVQVLAVDSGSEYMRKLYAHTGSEGREEQPTDPAAIESGVRGQIDLWSHEARSASGLPNGKVRHTDYYLTGPSRAALEKYLATVTPPPPDHAIVVEHVPADPTRRYEDPTDHYRTYFVIKAPLLETSAIGAVESTRNEVTNEPAVIATLTDAGRTAFAQATAANVSRKLAFLVDGLVISAPIIEEPIPGGQFAMRGDDALLAKLQCKK